jgi:hypothetical protein
MFIPAPSVPRPARGVVENRGPIGGQLRADGESCLKDAARLRPVLTERRGAQDRCDTTWIRPFQNLSENFIPGAVAALYERRNY